MNDSDDNSGLNISKLIPTSINEQISELVDGGQRLSPNGSSTYDSSNRGLGTDDEGSLLNLVDNDKPHIGVIDEMEPEKVWNKYLVTGYRINFVSWKQVFGSLFLWHNETMNIWTHMVGFVVYSVLLLVFGFSQMGEDHVSSQTTPQTFKEFFSKTQPMDTWDYGFIESQKNELTLVLSTMEQSFFAQEIQDGSYMPQLNTGFAHSEQVSKWPIVAYLMTALFCLGCSTACHWFSDKDMRMCRIVATLDYWGITILILGSIYPFISYRYACGYLIVYRYIFVSILTLLTIGCMVITVSPTFLKPTPKAVLFIGFGAFCFVPTLTLYILDDPENGLQPGLDPFTWSTLSYLVGLTFYMAKFPERVSKNGRFDILFSSHQIHHLCVLLGITIGFLESFETYKRRLDFVCPDQEVVPAI